MSRDYGVELTGILEIPNDGNYEWQLQSFDGLAELEIDGIIVAKGGNLANEPELIYTALNKGKYPFKISLAFYMNKKVTRIMLTLRSWDYRSNSVRNN